MAVRDADRDHQPPRTVRRRRARAALPPCASARARSRCFSAASPNDAAHATAGASKPRHRPFGFLVGLRPRRRSIVAANADKAPEAPGLNLRRIPRKLDRQRKGAAPPITVADGTSPVSADLTQDIDLRCIERGQRGRRAGAWPASTRRASVHTIHSSVPQLRTSWRLNRGLVKDGGAGPRRLTRVFSVASIPGLTANGRETRA